MEHEDLIVSMKGIQKSFGGVHALTDGELTLRKGEVLGLIGENGAGKSTLMKILSGVYQADAGVMLVDGKEVHYHEPRQALHDGICMIYQELNLVQHLSVGDNIFIGRESQKGWKLDRTKDNRRAEELLKELELDVSPNTTVSSLTVAKQQMIEIAKGISYDSKVLIMDEPTAALSINEIKDLFRVIQKLKAKGISIIYISHRLEELFEITDRITVMRDGAFINTFITKESSLPELIRSMVGREVSWEKKKHSNVAADAPVLLEVQGMESHAIKNASFKLRKGEILGIGGLMGAGRTELARLVFGADWRKHGKILKNGEEIQIRTPHECPVNMILSTLLKEGKVDWDHGSEQMLDFIYIEDCVEAIAKISLADHNPHAEYNIGGGEVIPYTRIIDKARKLFPTAPIHVGPGDLGYDNLGALSVQRAFEDFGWKPRFSIEQGMEQYMNWLKNF